MTECELSALVDAAINEAKKEHQQEFIDALNKETDSDKKPYAYAIAMYHAAINISVVAIMKTLIRAGFLKVDEHNPPAKMN